MCSVITNKTGFKLIQNYSFHIKARVDYSREQNVQTSAPLTFSNALITYSGLTPICKKINILTHKQYLKQQQQQQNPHDRHTSTVVSIR